MEKSKSNKKFSKTESKELEIAKEIRNPDKLSFLSDTSSVPINISEVHPDYVDKEVIAPEYYNNFNFSKLSKKFSDLNVTLGITSANKGEGKTLVASNMAVSLAQAYRQRTVLIDLNFKNPQLHNIFGVSQKPGLAEALETRMLKINPTKFDDLYLLSAGECKSNIPGIENTMALREILFTLKHEFDFVIADMSSVFPYEEFPVHFINEIDGLITVVDTQSTRQEQVDKIYKHIDENKFVGYIFNKIAD